MPDIKKYAKSQATVGYNRYKKISPQIETGKEEWNTWTPIKTGQSSPQIRTNPPPRVEGQTYNISFQPPQQTVAPQQTLRDWLTRPLNYFIGYGPGSYKNIGIGAYDQSVIAMGLTPRYSTTNPMRVDAWGFDPYEVGGSPYQMPVYQPTYQQGGGGGGWGGYGGGSYDYSSTPGIYGESVRRSQFYNNLVQWILK